MAGERILYVCFDPMLVVERERSLLDRGYSVQTVLGRDGLMAAKHIDDVEFIVIGDEGGLSERQSSVRWLREEIAEASIIALCRSNEAVFGADYQVPTAAPIACFESLANVIQRRRYSA